MRRQKSSSPRADSPIPLTSESAERSTSEPLRRAFSVLEIVAMRSGGLTASEVADQLNLPLGTAFRVLRRLADLGILDGHGRSARYSIGARFRQLAHAAVGNSSILDLAGPVVQRLADDLSVAAYLAGFFEFEALLLLVRAPTNARAPYVHPGRQFKIHASAGGKALLAFQPSWIIREFLSQPLERLTERTITDPTTFLAHLEEIRRRGFAVSSGESDSSLWGIAAPVLDHYSTASYSIGFICFRSDVIESDAFIGEVAPKLLQAANDIRSLTGGISREAPSQLAGSNAR